MSAICIIIGASHAGSQLALSLRQEGWEGRILVITDDAHMPYHRPPLSKGFIADDRNVSDIALRSPTAYADKHIEFLLNSHVEAIDREAKTIALANGESLAYNKLALTTGSRARRLDVPGSDLAGVHYLRNAKDAEAIRQGAANAKHIVIIGGGYIGLELAASVRALGLKVTVLEAQKRVLERVASTKISAFYQRIHEQEGVLIHCNETVSELVGTSRISAVRCSSGKEFFADMVVVGIGVVPNTELASAAGLAVDNGITVDEFAQTADANIVAAGDCTNHPNGKLGQRLRLESVPNALEQSKTAAASICGQQKPYSSVPWFWSDQYDMKLQIAGLSQGYEQVIIRGDIENSRSFAAFYLREGKVIAVDSINRPKEFMAVKQALNSNLALDISKLQDESVLPKELILQQADK